MTVTKNAGFLLISLAAACINVAASKFNPKELPVIIWWTDLLYPHAEPSTEIECAHGRCVSSARRRKYGRKGNATVAYLFYGSDFTGEDLPLPRLPTHRWALLHEESPANNYAFAHTPGISLFHYTATFSRHSHFPLTLQHLPSLAYLEARAPLPICSKRGTLYLASNCGVASQRDSYVRQLMQHLPIDSCGACLHNTDLPLHLSSTGTLHHEDLLDFMARYKFYLAFENAACEDYVTEKLFRAFHVGSVPVYHGSSSVRDWAPDPDSIILTDDFASPEKLAQHLIALDVNNTLYEAHLRFKREGVSNKLLKDFLLQRKWAVNSAEHIDFVQGFECYVCDRLHDRNDPPPPDRTHMDCPPPGQDQVNNDCGPAVHPKERLADGLSAEEWLEEFSYGWRTGRAIRQMLDENEEDSSRFAEYLTQSK